MKTFIFAIDGATWDIIDPLMHSGKMPNMAALVKKGARSRLKTLIPTESPQIWTSIATGTLPEKHGIEGFINKNPETGKTTLPTSNLRKKMTFWNILSSPDYSVGVVGWWATFPAEKVNGFIISDHTSIYKKKILKSALELTDDSLTGLSPRETYPGSLRQEIEDHSRSLHQYNDSELERFISFNAEDRERLKSYSTWIRDECLSVLKYLYINDELYKNAALFALDKYRPDLLTVFLAGVDGVEHHFWKYMAPEKFHYISPPPGLVQRYGKAIENYYLYLDEVLGQFLKVYSEDSLIIVLSDHGHEAEPDHGTDKALGYGKIACGTHDRGPDGILLVAGPGVKEGVAISGASVLDITPTILALNGKPVAQDMDGRVLREICRDDFFEKRPVSTVATYSPKDMGDGIPVEAPMDDEYRSKLRALGYIE